MGPRREPFSTDDWVGRVGRRRDDVRAGKSLGKARGDADVHPIEPGARLSDELCGLRPVPPDDAYLAEPPNAWHRAQMGAGLDPRADDREDGRIAAGQQVGRERGARGGSRRGDGLAVHERHRRPVVRIKDHDHRLMCGTVRVTRKERDELRRERARRGQVRGHRGQQRVARRDDGGDPLRHRGCSGGKLDHGAGHRIAQRVEIEEPLDLGSGEQEHRAILGRGGLFLSPHNDRP